MIGRRVGALAPFGRAISKRRCPPKSGAMAASSGDDILAQLSALLGHSVKRTRSTNEMSPRTPVIDLASAITMEPANQAAEQVAYVKKLHPQVTEIFGDFKIPHSIGVNFRKSKKNPDVSAKCTGVKLPNDIGFSSKS